MRTTARFPIHYRLNPEADRIALYLKLTSILRARITGGEWKAGDRIPSIEMLCGEYDVARNTVRQALELLKSDGLIGGGRGLGTFVLKSSVMPAIDDDLKSAISDPLHLGPDQSIQILQRRKDVVIPPALCRDQQVAESYTLIRKLHRFRDQPFALMDIYIDSTVYQRFPKGQDKTIKIARLLRDCGFKIAHSRLEITTRPADHEAAHLLDYSMAGSLVCMRRWRTDHAGRIVTAGIHLYRGDLFALDIVEPFAGLGSSRTDIVPRIKRRTMERETGRGQ